jgi:hypothetical protein
MNAIIKKEYANGRDRCIYNGWVKKDEFVTPEGDRYPLDHVLLSLSAGHVAVRYMDTIQYASLLSNGLWYVSGNTLKEEDVRFLPFPHMVRPRTRRWSRTLRGMATDLSALIDIVQEMNNNISNGYGSCISYPPPSTYIPYTKYLKESYGEWKPPAAFIDAVKKAEAEAYKDRTLTLHALSKELPKGDGVYWNEYNGRRLGVLRAGGFMLEIRENGVAIDRSMAILHDNVLELDGLSDLMKEMVEPLFFPYVSNNTFSSEQNHLRIGVSSFFAPTIRCALCSEVINNGDEKMRDGRMCCEKCMNVEIRHCRSCKSIHSKDTMTKADGRWYCSACARWKLFVCDDCKKNFQSTRIFAHYDSHMTTVHLCYDCEVKRQAAEIRHVTSTTGSTAVSAAVVGNAATYTINNNVYHVDEGGPDEPIQP